MNNLLKIEFKKGCFSVARLTILVVSLVPSFMASLAASSNAAASMPVMPEFSDWDGLYAGGFAGMATRLRITTTEPLRLDNNAYWFRPFHQSFNFKTKNSFIGGATIGYNYQIGLSPIVLGIEGEYSYLALRRSTVDPNQFPYANLPNNNLLNTSDNYVNIGKSYGYVLIGGRVGYTRDCLLFYAKSGFVFTSIQSSYHSIKTEDRMPAYLNLSGSKRIIGYGIGGGLEYILPFQDCSNVSTKIEYLFLGINKKQYVYGHCSCNFLWRTIEKIKGVHTIKIGINYKFGA